jgi:hypothetical protein
MEIASMNFTTGTRSPEEERAFRVLFGDGGFASEGASAGRRLRPPVLARRYAGMGRRHLSSVAVPSGLCRHYCCGRAGLFDRSSRWNKAATENGLVGNAQHLGRLHRSAWDAEVAGHAGGAETATPAGSGSRQRQ